MYLKHLTITLLLALSIQAHCQVTTNNKETFLEINNQIWQRFIETYNTHDPEGFLEIHSVDLVRIPRDSRRISDWPEYLERMDAWFNNAKANGQTQSISFRFIERFHNTRYASEVGIYRVVSNAGTDNEREFYGKFHVVLIREDSTWKILMDSDTSEGGTIDIEDFKKGHEMADFEPFLAN